MRLTLLCLFLILFRKTIPAKRLIHRGSKLRMTASIMIAGTQSGVGKTTITMGLIAALRGQGLRVQPFKAGPDYIDPTYHTLAAGRSCRNIDTWMVPPERAVQLYRRATTDVDIAVIEGVMGIFDGFSYVEEDGSSAQIAKLTNTPVVLVLDVGKMARSAGALALGYSRFDPKLNVAGFILNRCGSANHYQGAKRAVEQATGLPVVGWLPKDAELHIPERHLGLVPTNERGELTDFINYAGKLITEYFDLEQIIALARRQQRHLSEIEATQPEGETDHIAARPQVKIAVARDAAFSFYYEDNLDLLREAGAEIVFFSPVSDSALPVGVSGVYLGGGFPELYAGQLAANSSLSAAFRQQAAAGMPIYAECGGFMYLCEALTDLDGQTHAMVGLVPGTVQMQPKLVSLGYRLVESPTGNYIMPAGITVRGHEFHWSTWSEQDQMAATDTAWRVRPRRDNGKVRLNGYAHQNLVASYVHLHFAHDLRLAENFVRTCRDWSGELL
jgi:cobyrinic acid a,c-diamide synthase